ncbi:aldo/keto reductase [uncultured Holdemanella sp.]|uniref:aldo/keto reductase n=1 Tax=uncultured Holdemanella sp. TaxID=1763549 RepID=UPI002582EDFF|nr:aldo/keto reductase [uncultured Holdemanella sp.]
MNKMPKIGYGVFRITDFDECVRCVEQAIQIGYRFIDTAAAYGNEEAVGIAVQKAMDEGIVKREDLFIQTKLWITDTTYEKAKEGFMRSLKRLGLEYVDSLLIHQPYNDYYGAWRALEELYDEGLIKHIGVDNFTQDRMADFVFFNRVKPYTNMIECNPCFQRENERVYLEEQNIIMQAWSPLAAGKEDLLHNEILLEISRCHNKSVAQIILRWLVQRNIVPVVKSSNPNRMKENLDIFDFELTNEEMKQIQSLDTGHTYATARDNAKAVNNFLELAMKYDV